MEIHPSSMSQLSLNLMHGFLANFGCCFPWTLCRGIFFVLWKFFFYFFCKYFLFLLTWDVPYGSQNFKTLLLLQIAAGCFQSFPEFFSQWSSQNNVWNFWNFKSWSFNDFLALLDYVSRVHEIEICPSSVHPSVRRPSVSQLSLNLMHRFLSNFSCGFSWTIHITNFFILKIWFFFYFFMNIFRFR